MEPLTPTTIFEDTSDYENEEGLASRWWEAEAQRTLESTDSIKDIQLICNYVPFSNPNTRSLSLSEQWRPRLDALWWSAIQHTNDPITPVHERTSPQVAESIVRLLCKGQKTSNSLRRRHCWTPPSQNPPVNAERIAESLDSHASLLFHPVCSRVWIEAALGYNTAAVSRLFKDCIDTRKALWQWCKQNTDPTNMYQSVLEELRSRNSLAYWTVSSPIGASHSLFHCFHTLSARPRGNFMSWVRQLAVLAERFQQNIQTTDVDWNKNFLSDSPLLHQINCEDLVALARGISEEDIADFRTLDRNDFSDETKRLRGLGKGWQILSEDARACAVIDSDMGETIGKLAKQLVAIRDYYSATALLMGLQQANVSPPDVSFTLLHPDNNYAKYRAQWAKEPGIPFLFPHIKELRYTKDGHKLDGFLESLAFRREEPNTRDQNMVYSFFEDETSPRHTWGLREYLNCFRCF